MTVNIKTYTSALFIFVLAGLQPIYGQLYISLSAAKDSASRNNRDLNLAKQNADLVQFLTNTAKDIPKTNFGLELGQLNSALFDTKLGISQTIALPKVYKSQREVHEANYAVTQSNTMLLGFEINKNIEKLYNKYALLKAKQNVFDTLIANNIEVEKKVKFRFDKGESDYIEVGLAKNNIQNLQNQANDIGLEIKQLLQLFHYITNTQAAYLPKIEKENSHFLVSVNENIINDNPLVNYYQSQKAWAQKNTILEKVGSAPTSTLAY